MKYIHPTALLGVPSRPLLGLLPDDVSTQDPSIPNRVWIGAGVVIEAGVQIGEGCIIDHGCLIGAEAKIGDNCLFTYRASVGPETKIGCDCVIGGYVSERCIIGDRVRLFGSLVHKHRNPTAGWDNFESMEKSPTIGSGAFIGFGALIIGGVEIGENSYICANSIITRDVPPGVICKGSNQFFQPKDWPGDLSKSPLFH